MMNKLSTVFRVSSHKKGFALIVTLSVLAIISALTAVMIGYLDSARMDATRTKALLQANVYFADMKEVMTKFKKNKSLYNILYTAPIPIRSEEGDFLLVLQCSPMSNGVNINWLGYDNNQTMIAQYNIAAKLFDRLVEVYDIENPARLEEMLLEAIGKKRGDEGDQSRLMPKNGIMSYQQFMHIVSRYRFEEDDKNIETVPWEKYFVFNPVGKTPQENKIEGDYLSIEAISLLFDIEIERLQEEWFPSAGALKKLLADNAIEYDKKLFATELMAKSYCEVEYTYMGERYRFAYVDNEGEVNHFEFFGKQ